MSLSRVLDVFLHHFNESKDTLNISPWFVTLGCISVAPADTNFILQTDAPLKCFHFRSTREYLQISVEDNWFFSLAVVNFTITIKIFTSRFESMLPCISFSLDVIGLASPSTWGKVSMSSKQTNSFKTSFQHMGILLNYFSHRKSGFLKDKTVDFD